MSSSNLDSFVHGSHPPHTSVFTSQEIRDRGSAFIGNIYRANTPEDAKSIVQYHKLVVHSGKPAYEICAWRCMVLKHGKTGLSGPDDFELKTGFNDDGEQWAGSKILKVMQTESVLDAVVIVSRWFGGTLLGPARFTHIETCAREICRKFKRQEEMEECVTTLTSLDDILATLRDELKGLSANGVPDPNLAPATSTSPKSSNVDIIEKPNRKPDYSCLQRDLDLTKAKRLVNARESAIRSVKALIAKKTAL
ncbi:ribosomal protein S5 domain 2-type protein [Hygrophoropsis aurantiaca]|uniref:Ribosomal protein S5 domain 2-type protein n=1 Tax=Hygrophoropsis aurantiaca TaxID=72124 RepID=A0ACB7ZZF2_9AGAM|nr:ribosomal protein S5 domain 2-type protein [Hygrophoropsis aurantiaca]